MRRFFIHVTAIAISASAATVSLAAPASASRGGSAGKPSFQDLHFTVPVPVVPAIYIPYGDIKGEFRIPQPSADGISKVGQGVLTLAGSVVARSNRVAGNFIGTDLTGALKRAAGDFDRDGLADIVVGAVPDPAPLLLPAVQKVREAASRMHYELKELLISSAQDAANQAEQVITVTGSRIRRPLVAAVDDLRTGLTDLGAGVGPKVDEYVIKMRDALISSVVPTGGPQG